MTTVFHREELVRLSRSEEMRRVLDEKGQQIQDLARKRARVSTGRMRQDINHVVGTDTYGAYVDVYTSASRAGFRYGAYWNAVEHYLDDALKG
jgi:hypothetical protein